MEESPQTSLGALALWEPPPDEEQFFKNVIKLLDTYYPNDWRSWVINDVSFEDLFGNTISSDDENRLRFALPTALLAHAFNTNSLSEGKYKRIKRILIRWPLGRALIYAPLSTMKKVHPTNAYNAFMGTIQTLKPLLISRTDAAASLKNRAETAISPSPSPSQASASRDSIINTRKRAHSPDPVLKKIEDRMDKQDKILEQLIAFSRTSNYQYEDCSTISEDGDSWTAPALTSTEQEVAQQEAEEQVEGTFFNFAPETQESEAKVGYADESLAKLGAHCQRLGTPSWSNIRYADVQKQFQASPVFTNLKVNSSLATATPNWQTVTLLEKMDACLGAITYGLLQQRKQFEDAFNKASLEVKSYINKNFLASESSFRKTSDSLLQYTCGRRSEIIKYRRSTYKPPNRTLNDLLHAIPPSNTHLFSEPELSDLIKEQGGTNKFFPVRRHFSTSAGKSRPPIKSFNNNERKRWVDQSRPNERKPNFTYRSTEPRKRNPGPTYDGRPKRPRFNPKFRPQ